METMGKRLKVSQNTTYLSITLHCIVMTIFRDTIERGTRGIPGIPLPGIPQCFGNAAGQDLWRPWQRDLK